MKGIELQDIAIEGKTYSLYGNSNTTNDYYYTIKLLADQILENNPARKDFDHQCKHCSSICFQNQASSILKINDIEPYIWMDGDLKALAKTTLKKGQSFGVLGIACIPELVWGMRKYRKYKIPVIGIPLNANRCIRWFGEFFPNSINLNELEKLVSQ